MAKMAGMSIYGKTPLKTFFTRTKQKKNKKNKKKKKHETLNLGI